LKFSSPKIILIISSLTFLCFGIYNAGLGPVLYELANQTGSNLSAIGVIFTAIYSGSIFAQIASGWLTDRFGRRSVMIVSILLMATGILGFSNSKSLMTLVSFSLLTGLGQGGVDMVANIIVAAAYPKNNLAALNILHLCFGVGASIGPALVSLALSVFNKGLVVLWGAGVFFLILSGLFFLIRIPPIDLQIENEVTSLEHKTQRSIFLNPLVWVLGGMLSLVVGTQFGLGSWSTQYIIKTTNLNIATASMITSGFWVFITLGRIAAASASKLINRSNMLLLSLVGSLIGCGFLMLTNRWETGTVISLWFLSFFFGGMYPLLVSITTALFQKDTAKACSIVIAMGTVGGLTLPWLAGSVLENVGAIAYLFLISSFIASLLLLRFLVTKYESLKIT